MSYALGTNELAIKCNNERFLLIQAFENAALLKLSPYQLCYHNDEVKISAGTFQIGNKFHCKES